MDLSARSLEIVDGGRPRSLVLREHGGHEEPLGPHRAKRDALREVDHSTSGGRSSPQQATAKETTCPTITIWKGSFSPRSAGSMSSAPVACRLEGARVAPALSTAPTTRASREASSVRQRTPTRGDSAFAAAS